MSLVLVLGVSCWLSLGMELHPRIHGQGVVGFVILLFIIFLIVPMTG